MVSLLPTLHNKNTGIAEVHTERACSTGEKDIGKESQQKTTR
jgi:hypothetical protein